MATLGKPGIRLDGNRTMLIFLQEERILGYPYKVRRRMHKDAR